MFEGEKDERIQGIDANTAALSMALAHDFVLEILLTREMIEMEEHEARSLARVMVERWQRRYGQAWATISGRANRVIRCCMPQRRSSTGSPAKPSCGQSMPAIGRLLQTTHKIRGEHAGRR